MKTYYYPALILFLPIFLFAQKEIKLKPTDFRNNGQAALIRDNCYQLTPAQNWQSGSIWFKKPINLAENFEMELDCFFGCTDWEGADGIAFVFTSKLPRTGFQGEGLGYGGLKPSLAIEMDTYENYHLDDPHFDHIALMLNGSPHHRRSVSMTKQASPISPNIEDCQLHRLKVTWQAKSQQLDVYFDNSLRISYEKDLVQNIFHGEPLVYWGFTSATGGKNNSHQVCFEKVIFEVVDSEFDREMKKDLLKGEIKVLENLEFQSGQHHLLPSSYPELNKLVRLLKANPNRSIQIFGHTDSSGDANVNQRLSERRAQTVAEYLIKKGIPKHRLKIRGNGEKYPIASNDTYKGRLQNRRIEIMLVLGYP